MVSVCSGLVTIDQESRIIRLVHCSVKEFLEQSECRWFSKASADILAGCLTYISSEHFTSGFCENDRTYEERLSLYSFYEYAVQYWGIHSRESPMYMHKVTDFLNDTRKVEAASQALMVRKAPCKPKYSQGFPKRIVGLHLAAYFGLHEALPYLILRQEDVDLADEYGRTPLCYASMNGHQAVVQLLLNRGADIESKDNQTGQTPLLWAVEKGHEAVVQVLLDKGANIESRDIQNGRTPLIWAINNGHEAIVQLLLAMGANIESEDIQTRGTPLMWAVRSGHEGIIRLLLEWGANIESRAIQTERTPLIWAVGDGHEAIVQLLLDRGTDIESRDSNWANPCLEAIEQSSRGRC
jgi:ankyrin repeat protein